MSRGEKVLNTKYTKSAEKEPIKFFCKFMNNKNNYLQINVEVTSCFFERLNN